MFVHNLVAQALQFRTWKLFWYCFYVQHCINAIVVTRNMHLACMLHVPYACAAVLHDKHLHRYFCLGDGGNTLFMNDKTSPSSGGFRGGGGCSRRTPPPLNLDYVFCIPFCIRILKNRAQILRKNIKNAESLKIMWSTCNLKKFDVNCSETEF